MSLITITSNRQQHALHVAQVSSGSGIFLTDIDITIYVDCEAGIVRQFQG
ncbi:hypothetical protein PAUR_b0098 [Pseudoalteromonas aurantia 208]|uniref:Uncharacterized protein n=1 Tax=Pseudoalteromonas aurantia 208 TaxID=1314867 RepID=A0ABR9EGL3_9GAMM|nr:hypothetical protein [Pseudoalteromonas aurantia 208]